MATEGVEQRQSRPSARVASRGVVATQQAEDVIGATTWTGHESYGQVKSVRVGSENDITVTMAMSGEGETWVDHNRLRLSPDGNVLTVIGSDDQSGWTLYRVR